MKLVQPKKVRIFNYNSFSCALLLESKGLEIIFKEQYLTLESLFEIESILAWCTAHTEVKSVYFSTKSDTFIQGFNYTDLKNNESEKIKKLYSKLNTITQTLLCLPQTIVVEMKNGAKNEGLTFALAADIRLGNENAIYQFSELNHGLIAAAGLFTSLRERLNQSVLRGLVLSAIEFDNSKLNLLGGLVITNVSHEIILKNISTQSCIARVQTKCALLGLDEISDSENKFVEKLLAATLATNDYKSSDNFINLRELKNELKENHSENIIN